jgi:hypothetical protein
LLGETGTGKSNLLIHKLGHEIAFYNPRLFIIEADGEAKEEERIRRSDRMLAVDAILDAAYMVQKSGRPQMIASDIVEALERLANTLTAERDHTKIQCSREMADGLRYFTKDPVSSPIF